MCDCASEQLCPLCLDGRFAQLRGVAACRGEAWATNTAARVPCDRAWPRDSERATRIAREKVEDLARDPRLLELLAGELAVWAERRWNAQRATIAA
jgi:hypothetical protein